MKLKAKIMQILVADLQPNLIGAFTIMSLGVEIPDTVPKSDLASIINYLCKKLDWIEEFDEKTRTKSSGEISENNVPHDFSVDSPEFQKDEICGMDWIEDSFSGAMIKNSEEEKEDKSFHNTFSKSDDFDEIDFNQDNNKLKESVSNDKISGLKSELEINHTEGSEPKEKVNLDAHENTNGEGLGGSHNCPHCGKMFTVSKNLTRHIRNVHSNPTYKPFNCSYCKKGFNNRSNMKIHEMVHTGEKPYKCLACDYKCTTSSYLKIHERNHTGDMFNCSRCDMKFFRKSKLADHELTHDDPKPFKCSLCDKEYTARNGLTQHRIKVHNISGVSD